MTLPGSCKKAKLAFICPQPWPELAETSRADVRFCTGCQADVFKVGNDAQFRVAASLGRCVAMRSLDSMNLVVGNPPDANGAWGDWSAPVPRVAEVALTQPLGIERLAEYRKDFPIFFREPSPALLDGQTVRLGVFDADEAELLLNELAARAPELHVLLDGRDVDAN